MRNTNLVREINHDYKEKKASTEQIMASVENKKSIYRTNQGTN
jgi:hypothetical protein